MFNFMHPDLRNQENHPCLEFANTVDWHASDHPVETLHDYGDLLAWAFEEGLLQTAERAALQQAAQRAPEQAAQTYQAALRLREAIYGIFAQIAAGGAAEPANLEILSQALAETMPHLQLVTAPDGFAWQWVGAGDSLDRVLWPVALSAAQLLTSGLLERVGQCADDRGCGFLFFDTSRNRTRRWCDMKGCGNRAKAQRLYQRKRGGEPGQDPD
ncbi:MAG: hypothetical protein GYA59_04950 [Chloroflexi bacterium]|nr:hypothetical protein [Chloroflexota bacterium]